MYECVNVYFNSISVVSGTLTYLSSGACDHWHLNPRPVRGGWCNPHDFFWAGRHTVWRIVLKFSIGSLWSIFCATFGEKNWSGQVRSRSYDVIRIRRHNLRQDFSEIVSKRNLAWCDWLGWGYLMSWCQYMTGCDSWHCARWVSRSSKVTWGHWPRLNSQWQITNWHMFSEVSWGAESESVVHCP